MNKNNAYNAQTIVNYANMTKTSNYTVLLMVNIKHAIKQQINVNLIKPVKMLAVIYVKLKIMKLFEVLNNKRNLCKL